MFFLKKCLVCRICRKEKRIFAAEMRGHLHHKLHIVQRRRLFARLLLSVFVSMLSVSMFHVHEEQQTPACSDCTQHVSHGGHLANGSSHGYDCLLCQQGVTPYVAAQPTVILFFVSHCKSSVSWLVKHTLQDVVLLKHPRGPPCLFRLFVTE